MKSIQHHARKRRKRRVRASVFGSASRPRLSVARSLRGLSLQVIDDEVGRTLAAASWKELGNRTHNTVKEAHALGLLLADKCLTQDIKTIVFDRSGYRYHGKVKAVAEGARKGGLIF